MGSLRLNPKESPRVLTVGVCQLALAKKLGREPYNITMAKNYKKLKPMFE